MPSYVIYCRKSSESEERQVLSIESQIKELNGLAQRLQLPISDTLTESRSAKSPGRPMFAQLMEKVSRGEVKGIVSWKLDRLARNPVDGASIVWALDQGKIEEIITPYNHLHNNSNDKFLMQLEFGMAKKYVDDLSDNVRRGLRMKLDKGWLPGLPPVGYLNEPRDRTIIPDPERFAIVKQMWELLLQGFSPTRIHRIASDELGLRKRDQKGHNGIPVSLSCVYGLFSNPFYYGVIRRKGNVYQGKHQPMIAAEDYWKAQELLGREGIPRPKTHEFAFTGFIKCGECGCNITAEEKINRYGSHYTYYHCTKRKRSIKCTQKFIQEKELERQMIEYLDKIHISQRLLEIALTHLEKENEESRQREVISQHSLEKVHRECERQLETLNQMRLRELLGDEEYVREKRKLLDEKIRAEKSLDRLSEGGRTAQALSAEAFTFAHNAEDRFEKGPPETRKTVIQGIGSNFVLTDKKLFIDVEKPFRLIEKTLNSLHAENGRFELQKNEMNKGSSALQQSDFVVMSSPQC